MLVDGVLEDKKAAKCIWKFQFEKMLSLAKILPFEDQVCQLLTEDM